MVSNPVNAGEIQAGRLEKARQLLENTLSFIQEGQGFLGSAARSATGYVAGTGIGAGINAGLSAINPKDEMGEPVSEPMQIDPRTLGAVGLGVGALVGPKGAGFRAAMRREAGG